MPHAVLIQDFTTITGQQNGVVIQNEGGWVETSGYQDAAFYLEISNCTSTGAAATVNLYVQTSPTKDAAFFDASGNASNPGSIANFQFTTGGAGTGVQAIKISRWATEANQPLGKYLRWKIVFPATSANYTITFRLWATLNQAGY